MITLSLIQQPGGRWCGTVYERGGLRYSCTEETRREAWGKCRDWLDGEYAAGRIA